MPSSSNALPGCACNTSRYHRTCSGRLPRDAAISFGYRRSRSSAISLSSVALSGAWTGWKAGPAEEVLRPEHDWEGASLPRAPSYRGAIGLAAHPLRDPAVFEEDGRCFLLYAVRGEGGIAIAALLERS